MPIPYENLSDLHLIALAIWREARGEPIEGKRGVAFVIANRVRKPGWWGKDWKSVILKPWQFSSFNSNDPNSSKWPTDDSDPTFNDCLTAAYEAHDGLGADPTSGAFYYHDTSIPFPKAWGEESQYENTLTVGRLKFYKPITYSNRDAVQEASAG